MEVSFNRVINSFNSDGKQFYGLDTASDNLGDIGAGVDAEGQTGDQNLVLAGSHDDVPHDEQLDHGRRPADHINIDIRNSREHGTLPVPASLHVQQARDCTENKAQHCGEKRDFDRLAKALQVKLPSVVFNKSRVKLL